MKKISVLKIIKNFFMHLACWYYHWRKSMESYLRFSEIFSLSNREHLPFTFRIYKVSWKTNVEIIDGIEVNFVEMQMLYTDHTLPCLANFYGFFNLNVVFSLRELKWWFYMKGPLLLPRSICYFDKFDISINYIESKDYMYICYTFF